MNLGHINSKGRRNYDLQPFNKNLYSLPTFLSPEPLPYPFSRGDVTSLTSPRNGGPYVNPINYCTMFVFFISLSTREHYMSCVPLSHMPPLLITVPVK